MLFWIVFKEIIYRIRRRSFSIKELEDIYKETRFLDTLFLQQYNILNPDFIQKNCLELLVEIGELANETRCFKYWSTKKASEKSIILEEWIDCLFMILYFCNILNVSLDEVFPEFESQNIIEIFLDLYRDAVEFS